ncbi:hypothetical protein [Bdellovibrio sp. ZAP7]|uniref:hypothetical protein n=1 Tax=Bdellovibrio sp. ZAP7 TaxID=2231053 RepID=UPI001AEF7381|nr:hypothetical protein [Bdellovibrio sp. ZAP7]
MNHESMKSAFITLALLVAPAMLNAQIKPHCFAQPCSIKGDFDGDTKEDVADLVENSNKRGIRIKFGSGKQVIIGAGEKSIKGLTDLMWMNLWELHKGPIEKATIKGSGKAPSAKGDTLKLSEEFATSGTLYWDGKEFKWYPQVGK